MEKAANLLIKDSKKSINEVMYAVGYSSQSYFTSAFKKEYGKTPAQFKKSNINPPTETWFSLYEAVFDPLKISALTRQIILCPY